MVYFRLTQRTIKYDERHKTGGPLLDDPFFPFPPVRAHARGLVRL
jgi:hypothetical protein